MASESAPRAMTHRIEVILLGGLARGPATRLKRPLLAALVFMLDRWLQRLQGIFEYTVYADRPNSRATSSTVPRSRISSYASYRST